MLRQLRLSLDYMHILPKINNLASIDIVFLCFEVSLWLLVAKSYQSYFILFYPFIEC